MGKVVIDVKEKSSETGEMMVGTVIVVLIASTLFLIISIFAAFIVTGFIWGIFACIKNYCCGVVTHGLHMGKAIALAWEKNVGSAKYFFDKAKYYDHILPKLVKPFLVLVGVGDIFMATVLFPVCIVLHLVGLLLYLPFWGVGKMIKSKRNRVAVLSSLLILQCMVLQAQNRPDWVDAANAIRTILAKHI